MVQLSTKYRVLLSFVLPLICLAFFLSSCQKKELPELSVYASAITEDESENTTIVWTVENNSNTVATFEEGNLAIVQINGRNLGNKIAECSLEAGESMSISIPLHDIKRYCDNEITITALCQEGTSATYKFTLTALK